ncbi:hypothetical protein CYMTET_54578 [Cymbomonas tetramitiformis]|uniref:EF-hand domain-containing protein n=1 Tax=Cymbomonas tetramitiformis TaxID=36881 RepID=A0AAE0BEX8_9CHLO|nr:hypothetical protein CYMTET_54578 [Cymbomonas tetramitiformis]
MSAPTSALTPNTTLPTFTGFDINGDGLITLEEWSESSVAYGLSARLTSREDAVQAGVDALTPPAPDNDVNYSWEQTGRQLIAWVCFQGIMLLVAFPICTLYEVKVKDSEVRGGFHWWKLTIFGGPKIPPTLPHVTLALDVIQLSASTITLLMWINQSYTLAGDSWAEKTAELALSIFFAFHYFVRFLK